MRFRVTNDHITHLMLRVSLQPHSDLRSADERGSRMHLPSCQECQSRTVKWCNFATSWSWYLFIEALSAPALVWNTCTALHCLWTHVLVLSSHNKQPQGQNCQTASALALPSPSCWLLHHVFSLGPSGAWKAPSGVELVVRGYGQLTGGGLSSLSWCSLILFLTWRHLTLVGAYKGGRQEKNTGPGENEGRQRSWGTDSAQPGEGQTTFMEGVTGQPTVVDVYAIWPESKEEVLKK